jgi:hypothetical protein
MVMATNQSTTDAAETCPWCGRPLAGGRTVTVGPPPHLGERHAFEMHDDCATAWESFVDRARALAARGGRETLLSYPLENGTGGLVD